MNESIIQQQLMAAISEAATVTEFRRMRDDTDIHGRPFLARDRLRIIYEGRLRGVLQNAPERMDLQQFCESALSSLAVVADDEPLFSWCAQTPSHGYSGISTPLRIIAYRPYKLGNA